MAKSSKQSVTPVRKGKRLYGGIVTFDDGRTCYLAYRRTAEIFRSGEKSISDAVRKGVACWALDDDTLLDMKRRGIPLVGVRVKESGDVWMARLVDFYDKTKVHLLNYEARGGALQRYLPLGYFRRRHGRVKVR